MQQCQNYRTTIKKRALNLLCVLDLFFRTLAVNSVSDFFFYRTARLISHPGKVMLKITLNRLQPQADMIAEEQAGFRAGKNTTEQTFNLRIVCGKYLQHQQDLYHVLLAFKKAFDRVWHAAVSAAMKKHQHQPHPNHQTPL